MDELKTIQEVISAGGGIGTLVIIFLLWRAGIIKLGKNGNPTPEWAETLIAHFNHDTTDALDKLDKRLEKHDDLERESLSILKEIKEYGVPCKDKK